MRRCLSDGKPEEEECILDKGNCLCRDSRAFPETLKSLKCSANYKFFQNGWDLNYQKESGKKLV
jgi:hypothetical protein